MKYYVEEWETDEVIAEFETDEERTAWINENCYPNQYMTAYYQKTGHGDVRIAIADY